MRIESSGTQILVVDDEEGMRRTLVRLLERHGYKCGWAANPSEARQRMSEQDFAVVLTDMNMPGGETGLDLITDLRRTQRMSRYCGHIARAMGIEGERSELIRVASQMHDVGKIGIPDSILLKPGALAAAELEVMKTHAEIGKMILEGS